MSGSHPPGGGRPARRTFAARRVTRTALVGLILLVALAAWFGRDQHRTPPAAPADPTVTASTGGPTATPSG